jgi:hypothetical protein
MIRATGQLRKECAPFSPPIPGSAGVGRCGSPSAVVPLGEVVIGFGAAEAGLRAAMLPASHNPNSMASLRAESLALSHPHAKAG